MEEILNDRTKIAIGITVGIFIAVLLSALIIIDIDIVDVCEYRIPSHFTVDIVMTSFSEDLTWVTEDPFFSQSSVRVFLYHKHPTQPPKILQPFLGKINLVVENVPNVGRCDHTMLHHLEKRYDEIGDVTISLPGSTHASWFKSYAWHHVKKNLRKFFTCDAQQRPMVNFPCTSRCRNPNFTMDDYTCISNCSNRQKQSFVQASPRGMYKWFRHHAPWWHGNELTLERMSYMCIFAVNKAGVCSIPRRCYKQLLAPLSEADNIEAGHYMERLWVNLWPNTTVTGTIVSRML